MAAPRAEHPRFLNTRGYWTPWTLVWLIVAAGVIARFLRYAANQSLFCDEAALVVNIVERDFVSLLQPLDFHQAAPPGFLWSVKEASLLFGASEWSLRIAPLIAGCAALILFARLGLAALRPAGAVTGTVLMAFSWQLVNYSHFVKQYALDVFASTLCLWAGYRFCVKPALAVSTRALAATGIAGAVLLWFSHPAVFVLGGVGAAIAYSAYRQKGVRGTAYAAVPSAMWAVSFGAEYFINLKHSVSNPILLTGWQQYFAPLPIASVAHIQWYVDAALGIFSEMDGTPAARFTSVLLALAAMAGAHALWNQSRALFLLTVAPLFLVLAASAAERYPFNHRLVFFLFPLVIFLTAKGLDEVVRRFGVFAAAGLMIIVLTPVTAKTLAGVILQPGTQEVRPLLARVIASAKGEDAIAVHYSAVPAFKYYVKHRFQSWMQNNVIAWNLGLPAAGNPDADADRNTYPAQVCQLAGRQRLWVIFSKNSTDVRKSEMYFLNLLDSAGRRLSELHETNASAFLYDLRPRAEVPLCTPRRF